MFVRVKGKGKYRYLQLVENHREGGRTVQRLLCTLGREEEVRTSVRIGALMRSLERLSQQVGPGGRKDAGSTKSVSTKTPAHKGWIPDQVPLGSTRASTEVPSRDFRKDGAVVSHESEDSRAPVMDIRAEMLNRSPILANLAKQHLIELSWLARERTLRNGEFLFFQDDPVQNWYMVISGLIKAVRHSPSGKDFIRAIFGPGETLANILLFIDKPHYCSAQAISDASILEIRRDDFISFLLKHPELSFKVLLRMVNIGGKRFLDAVDGFSELALEKTDYRLARTLVALNFRFGAIIPLNSRELAEMAGTSLSTASRFLNQLRATRVVQSYRGKLAVLQQDKLCLLARVPFPK